MKESNLTIQDLVFLQIGLSVVKRRTDCTTELVEITERKIEELLINKIGNNE